MLTLRGCFLQTDTSWLTEGADDLLAERERKAREEAEREAEIERKMAMWLEQSKNKGQ